MRTNLLSFLLLPFQILAASLGMGVGFACQFFIEINNRLAGISLIERFDQFPSYESSQEEYSKIRSRIEVFCNYVLSSQETELTLTADEINSVRAVRGEIDKKRKTMGKTQEVFEILDSEKGILERRFIAPFATRYGFLDRATLIRYEKNNGIWVELRQVIEEYGKPVEQGKRVTGSFLLARSPLLFLILTENRSPQAQDKFAEMIKRIKEISISNGTLSIRT